MVLEGKEYYRVSVTARKMYPVLWQEEKDNCFQESCDCSQVLVIDRQKVRSPEVYIEWHLIRRFAD